MLYYNLKDEGRTETLKTEVEIAWASDIWDLRVNLLGKSLHISMDVLKKTAEKTDVFPESIIFEIMAANPDALRKGELMKYLETKENPLPDYMIDILRQVATGLTYKTVLENQLNRYSSIMYRSVFDMIRSNLNDTVENLPELRYWLDKIGTLSGSYQIVSSYLQENDFTSALALANSLPEIYELTEDEIAEHNNYIQILGLYSVLDQDDRTIFQLDSTEIQQLADIAENSTGIAGSYAKNILSFAYGYRYCDCPYVSDTAGMKSSSAIISEGKNNLESISNITVFPNPAKGWVSFNYTLPDNLNYGNITITDINGKVIKVFRIENKQGQIVWDTRETCPGVYFYKMDYKHITKTGKFVINK